MTISFPSTKQARRMFASAMKRHGVEIVKSKTRDKVNVSGLDYELWNMFWHDTQLKANARTIEFHVSFDDMDQLTNAMEEFEAMLTLSGKQFDNRRSWKYRYGSNYKIIKVLAVLNN